MAMNDQFETVSGFFLCHILTKQLFLAEIQMLIGWR